MLFDLIPAAVAEEATAADLATATEVAEAAPTWAEEAVEKFAETPVPLWISLAAVAALAVVVLVISRSSKKWSAKMLSYGALCIALSFVLSCIRLYRMPQGGSVTPASMLPLMLFAAAYGVGPGMLAGLVYGVLQFLQGGYFLNVGQFLLDYLLAFAALGLTGLARKLPQKWGLYLAMVIAALGRALSATLAGILFWESAPVASLVYNGTYLIPDTAICILLGVLVGHRLIKMMRQNR